MASDSYSGLSVEMRRLEDQGRWLFGVLVEGAFVAFAERKLGGVDDDIVSALEAAAQAKAAAFAPPREEPAAPPETPPATPPVSPVTE